MNDMYTVKPLQADSYQIANPLGPAMTFMYPTTTTTTTTTNTSCLDTIRNTSAMREHTGFEYFSTSNIRQPDDQCGSLSPVSITSYSSSASFPEEPVPKKSRKMSPRKVRQPTASIEDAESTDEAELRQKSLERNRLAASKCRQRKKEWIQELAQRADRMMHENQQLKQELLNLRNETVYLKTQLMLHKENDFYTCKNKLYLNIF